MHPGALAIRNHNTWHAGCRLLPPGPEAGRSVALSGPDRPQVRRYRNYYWNASHVCLPCSVGLGSHVHSRKVHALRSCISALPFRPALASVPLHGSRSTCISSSIGMSPLLPMLSLQHKLSLLRFRLMTHCDADVRDRDPSEPGGLRFPPSSPPGQAGGTSTGAAGQPRRNPRCLHRHHRPRHPPFGPSALGGSRSVFLLKYSLQGGQSWATELQLPSSPA